MAGELFEHKNITGPHVHAITNWRFVDTAARMDPSNMFTFRDIDKVCYDAETQEYYALLGIDAGTFAPVWKRLSAPEASGEANELAAFGVGMPMVGPKIGVLLGVKSLHAGAGIAVTEHVSGSVTISRTASPTLWGELGGLLSDQADLAAALNLRPLSSSLSPAATTPINSSARRAGADTSLLLEGHYGLGWRANLLPESSPGVRDVRQVTRSGFWYGLSSDVNAYSPAGGVGNPQYLIHASEANASFILAAKSGTSTSPHVGVAVRTTESGSYSSFVNLLHSGNFSGLLSTELGTKLVAGAGVTITPTGGNYTIAMDLGTLPGGTDLAYVPAELNGVVTSNTGADATIPAATYVNAGLQSAPDKVKLDSLPDDILSIVRTYTADLDLSALTMVTENGDVIRPVTSLSSETDVYTIRGMSINSADAGDPADVLVTGYWEDTFWSFTPGVLYLSTTGTLTQVEPVTGFSVILGVALTATKIRLDNPLIIKL